MTLGNSLEISCVIKLPLKIHTSGADGVLVWLWRYVCIVLWRQVFQIVPDCFVCLWCVCMRNSWLDRVGHAGWKYVLGGDGWNEGVSARRSSGSRRGWRSPESATQAAFLTLITACNVFTTVFLYTGEGVCLVPCPFGGVCLLSCPLGVGKYTWSHVPWGGYTWSHVPFRGVVCLVLCPFWGVCMSGTPLSPGRYTPEGTTPQCWHLVVATEAAGTHPTGMLSCTRSTSATATLGGCLSDDTVLCEVMLHLNEYCELHRLANHKSLESSGFPLGLEKLENLEKWEGIFQSGKSQGILNRLEKSGKSQGKPHKILENWGHFRKNYLLFFNDI